MRYSNTLALDTIKQLLTEKKIAAKPREILGSIPLNEYYKKYIEDNSVFDGEVAIKIFNNTFFDKNLFDLASELVIKLSNERASFEVVNQVLHDLSIIYNLHNRDRSFFLEFFRYGLESDGVSSKWMYRT